METGISLYLGTGIEENKKIIAKAKQAKAKYAFTSLHIPEEQVADYQTAMKQLLDACQGSGLHLFIDVSPLTLKKLGYTTFKQLLDINVTHLRLDYGFTHQDIVDLAKDFHIVFNSSTVLESDIRELQRLGADFTRFIACHNFYPKPLTGISIQKVKELNFRLRCLGMQSMAFVSGDKTLRGPLHLGLPTVEEHRNQDVLWNMLALNMDADTDICLIGDVDIQDDTWQQLHDISLGFISIRATIDDKYAYLRDVVHHDRPDSSDYIFRSQESRALGVKVEKGNIDQSEVGSLRVANEAYGRYEGEFEIARQTLAKDDKINIVGKLHQEDLRYLKYLRNGLGCKLI